MDFVKKIFFICILLSPFFVHSQKWVTYSDSVLIQYRSGNIPKANQLIQLIENELNYTTIIKDTIYADYLYRKGITFIENKNFDEKILIEALSIWNNSKIKNHTKIMKIHFFLGNGFHSVGKFKEAYEYYKNCYNINLKQKIPINSNFTSSLYMLGNIEYNVNKNDLKAKEFLEQYIKINKEKGVQNFEFNLAYAYRFTNDDTNYGKTLHEFENEYINQNPKNETLLFQIYFELFTYYYKIINLQGIIKYGELSLQQIKRSNKNPKEFLLDLYPKIIWGYHEIGDINNTSKYEKIYEKFVEEENEFDFKLVLEKVSKTNNLELFKSKFQLYEDNFNKSKDYNKVYNLYNLFLNHEINEIPIFLLNEKIKKIKDLQSKNKFLTDDDKAKLELLTAETLYNNKEYIASKNICNKNLNTNNKETLLEFYRIKYWCEYELNDYKLAAETAKKSHNIFISIHSDSDIRVIPYLEKIIASDIWGTSKETFAYIEKGLKIIYLNKRENTQIAYRFFTAIAEFYRLQKNYNDAVFYYEKSIIIQDSAVTIEDPFNYYTCLSNIYIIKSTLLNDNSDLKYEEKLKIFFTNNPKFIESISDEINLERGSLNLKLGFLRNDPEKIKIALNLYELHFKNSKNNSYDTNYSNLILCKYLIDNNINNYIKSITSYEEKWGIHKSFDNLIYSMMYRNGEISESKNILISKITNELIKLASTVNDFGEFDLDNEIIKLNSAFEYLNNHLNTSDLNFISQYINLDYKFRNLRNNINREIITDNEAKKLVHEYDLNITNINKSLENKSLQNIQIENLRSRNREIEKLIFEKKIKEISYEKTVNENLDANKAIVKIIRINKQVKKYPVTGFDIFNDFTDSIQYGAIIIRKNSPPKYIIIDSSNQLEKSYLVNFKENIENKKRDEISYKLIFEKIENELEGIDKIYFMPDGVYYTINIESIYNPIKKQYLVDYYDIEYIEDYNSLITKKVSNKVFENQSAVLIGNPTFNIKVKSVNKYELNTNLNDQLFRNLKNQLRISQLPGTQIEIDKIKSIIEESNYSTQLYTQESASEENLKAIKSPTILHIATHGYFIKTDTTTDMKKNIISLLNEKYKDESFLKSGLLFSGAQNTINGESANYSDNGILTGEEAKKINLKNTELVILSACETGIGDYKVGLGVLSLQRAFKIAGAKSVIMSLWPVSDFKTQELMVLFYNNWLKNKLPINEAFKKAKLELKKKYTDPYFWAGFILV